MSLARLTAVVTAGGPRAAPLARSPLTTSIRRSVTVCGSCSPAAYRRAIAHGHGWYGNGQSPRDLARHLEGLHQAAGETERPAWLGRLEISFLSLAPAVSPSTARQYADLGADRLVLYPPSLDDPAEVDAFLRHHVGLLHLPGADRAGANANSDL